MQDKVFDINLIKAIIGLGNPGPGYYKTRHSIGFRVVDQLAQQYGASFNQSDNKEYAQVQLDSNSVYLIKPMTFMNKSGQVIPFLQKKGIKPEEIIVIHDELEKEFGNVSIKFSGGAKGHNGLRSIIGMMGQDFWRLRFGIGRPESKDDVGNYVLSPFLKEEELAMSELIDKAINLILSTGIR
jgi:PTH1 family peptidyl-tRNA hydrolase